MRPHNEYGGHTPMNGVDVALIVLTLTLAAVAGARRLKTPMSVVLAVAGIAAGYAWHSIPGLPPVRVPPERVLFIFLPPLLVAAAHSLPLDAFRRNLTAIAALAVGLVLATMVAAAATAHLVIGLPWAAAFVLGAIVAPPDPLAATAVGGQTGLPHRLVVVLEGEGLVNDAVAIVAYHLAVAAAVTGIFSWDSALLTVARESAVGVATGAGLGWITAQVRQRLNDVALEGGISLLVPYLTYHVADRLMGSGVLAVVALGFTLQRREIDIATPATRIGIRTVWTAVRFATTAVVFFLLGFILGDLIAGSRTTWRVTAAGGAVALAAVVIRMIWMFAVPHLRHWVSRRTAPLPNARELTVAGWAGMRGVVSLSLALALPVIPNRGFDGDARSAIILLTFAVIVVTLVVQGSLLLPLIDWLGVGDPDREKRDERRIRSRAKRAGLAAVAREVIRDGMPRELCEKISARIGSGDFGIADIQAPATDPKLRDPLLRALDAQRDVLRRMRDAGLAGEKLTDRLATEIDIDATRARGDTFRVTSSGDE